MIGFSGFPQMASNILSSVRKFYALAPVTTVAYIKSPIRLLAPYRDEIAKFFGNKEMLADPHGILKLLGETICADPETVSACVNIFFVIGGFDAQNLNATRIPVYVAHTPSGTSVKNVLHFAQLVTSQQFAKYDYGSPEANLAHYGQPTPPVYDVSPATYQRPPFVAFTGGADWLADPRDVLGLLGKQFHGSLVDLVHVPEFNHLDFGWGIQANRKIYDYIVKDVFN